MGGKGVSMWTREEAAGMLRLCSAGKHWVTTPTCDSCWVNEHRCPPTLAEVEAVLRDVGDLQGRAEVLRKRLGSALGVQP